MLQEDKQILWRASAVLLGMALPTLLLGKGMMYGLLLGGMLSGLLATKGESLRATLRLLVDSKLTLLGLLLMASLLVGVATGINPTFALDRWVQVGLVGLGGALLMVTLREMPGRHLELLLKVLAIAVMVAAGFSMLDAFIDDRRLSTALHGTREALTMNRLTYMSAVFAVLMPFVWARLMIKAREGEPFAGRIVMPAAGLGFVAAIVCGGQAGWAGLLVGTVVFLWMAGRYHGLILHKKDWLMGLGVVVLGAVLYGLAFGWQFILKTAETIPQGTVGDVRGAVWSQVLANVMNEPLFGIGVMNYRNLPGAFDLHPHNWLLQMLLEGGIVSTLLFVVIMGMIVVKFVTYGKASLYGVAAVASVSAFLVSGLAGTSIFNAWWLTLLMVVCVLGWRAGWGGSELKKRRRTSAVVKNTTGF